MSDTNVCGMYRIKLRFVCLVVHVLPAHYATGRRSFASRKHLVLLSSSVCHELVKLCEQLQAAFDVTNNQDAVVGRHPSKCFDTIPVITMSMDLNTLTVQSSEDRIENLRRIGTRSGWRRKTEQS